MRSRGLFRWGACAGCAGIGPILGPVERGPSHGALGPVFLGGTGRCGTHVVASLAASSGRYAQVPAELRLHISPDGLPAFVEGRHSRRRLLRGLRTHWWSHRPEWDRAERRGAYRITPRGRYLLALARLAAAPPRADRTTLCRRFVSSLLDPLATEARAWVEKSPDNCAAAGFLARLYPRLRVIHVIRDGRDVACSFMRVPWAPDDFADALAVWERGMLDAHLGTLEVPAESIHRLLLEDLVRRDREHSYRSLLGFLGIPDEPRVRSHFERELTPGRARIGRWRSDLPRAEHARADALYAEALGRLAAAGVTPLPPLAQDDPAEGRGGAGEAGESPPLDPWAAMTAKVEPGPP